MRNVLSRKDYEELFRGQSYPKRTAAAGAELVTRGLKANVATLDYLVSKGVIEMPPDAKRQWQRWHIGQAARYLADREVFTPGGWRCVIEDVDPGQDIRAFHEACSHAPHLPPDSSYFIRTVMPGVAGLGVYATVSYRAMTEDELADWQRKIELAKGQEVLA